MINKKAGVIGLLCLSVLFTNCQREDLTNSKASFTPSDKVQVIPPKIKRAELTYLNRFRLFGGYCHRIYAQIIAAEVGTYPIKRVVLILHNCPNSKYDEKEYTYDYHQGETKRLVMIYGPHGEYTKHCTCAVGKTTATITLIDSHDNPSEPYVAIMENRK